MRWSSEGVCRVRSRRCCHFKVLPIYLYGYEKRFQLQTRFITLGTTNPILLQQLKDRELSSFNHTLYNSVPQTLTTCRFETILQIKQQNVWLCDFHPEHCVQAPISRAAVIPFSENYYELP